MTRDPPLAGASPRAASWPYGGGVTGALVREVDWSATSLGPLEGWPDNLRTTVTNLLHTRHPVFLFWGPHAIQFYNDAYLPIVGEKHPAAMGQRGEVCWREIWPIISPQIDDALREAKPSWNEDQLVPIFRNGRIEEVYFTYSYSPVFNDRGSVDGVLVVCAETTKRVLVERRLRRRQALTESLALATSAADILARAAATLAQGSKDVPFAVVLLVVSPAGEARVQESVGLDAAAVPPALLARAQEAMREGQVIHLGSGGGEEGFHLQAGPWPEAVTEAFLCPLHVAGDDNIAGAILFGVSPRATFDDAYRDHFLQITAQIESALSLDLSRSLARVAQQDLRDFFLQAPAPMCILTGPDHLFTLANEPYLDLVGKHVLGKTVLEAFSQEVAGPFITLLDEVYRTGAPFIGKDLPFDRITIEGVDHLMINVGYHPFRASDGVIKGILVFIQDVTEQVEGRRELQTAVASRDAFLAIASHELRTPLTSLKLQIQLNLRKLRKNGAAAFTSESLEKFLVTTARQADRLSRLVEDMLDISRIAAGRLSMTPEHGSLSALVHETIEHLSPELTAAGLPLSHRIEEGIEGEWDRYRLEQVLTNLLTNAVRYAPGAPLEISLQRETERVVLAVRDSGPGIAEENLERIFERFERLKSSNERGLGLGLYICRQIVEAHGGTIRAESQVGKGTTFLVALPTPPG